MAATRLIALHINKGKTVAQCLADRTDYSENEEHREELQLHKAAKEAFNASGWELILSDNWQ